MARPSNKSTTSESTTTPAKEFSLPAPIADQKLELMYLLGHLRGKVAFADRITELVLILDAANISTITALKARIGEE